MTNYETLLIELDVYTKTISAIVDRVYADANQNKTENEEADLTILNELFHAS